MTTQDTVEQLHRLVADYHQRSLSTVDYRQHRRHLLDQLDARINGIQQPAPAPAADITDLITRRKHD